MVENIVKYRRLADLCPDFRVYEVPEELYEKYKVPGELLEVTQIKLFLLEKFIKITKSQVVGEPEKFFLPIFTSDANDIKKILKLYRKILIEENFKYVI